MSAAKKSADSDLPASEPLPTVKSFHEFLMTRAKVRSSGSDPKTAGGSEPYSFKGREALEEVVHLIDHILGSTRGGRLTDARLALAGGAQFGKTTLELNLAAYAAACRFLNPIVFLPDDGLAAGIVDAKFRPEVLDQVDGLAEMTRLGRSVNRSGKAVNTKGAFLVTDGERRAVGLFRGLQKPPTTFTADLVIEDEKDDIKRANAKYISGRLSASPLRFHLEVGTQRIHGAGQNLAWKSGSQGVVLVAPRSVVDRFFATNPQPSAADAPHGHRHVTTVPSGFINPEDAWPQICRRQMADTPRPDDPVLGFEGDFRRPGNREIVATFEPDGRYYYAHPETGEELDCARPLWHHRVPAQLEQRRYSFRVAQIGTAAIDLAQIVAHWTRAVADAEEMITFRCDRQALPQSAAQALTPEILARSRATGGFALGAHRPGLPRYAGLDMGDRCWYVCRETASPADKRLVHAAQLALGDVVNSVLALCTADGVGTLFIDERPAVSEARTLALALNGLDALAAWPTVDWKNRDTYVSLPGGLAWDGRQQKWLGLRCALVRFTKNQLGAGLEQGAVEFTENGVTKFVPVVACNRFESVDRVVREFLTPTENVVEVVTHPDGTRALRTSPALRLPQSSPATARLLETLDAHLLAGAQREKDERTGELGDYVDGIDNHFLFATAYSALAETVGVVARAAPFSTERIGHRPTRHALAAASDSDRPASSLLV